ncbi:unnamed protein product [Rangifer tarandus platyrhynchus]|uniref:Uncharacterized protein n=1 Tax=Rangifer tarandus platyrhynchus TaxID=3082113 RepID=A0ABN8XIK7_RANTA|nr:unnamed protein product [Rangifer tarandus platyrhynchus]
MFLGAGEDLETEGASDLEGAFLELEYPDMPTVFNKCRPPCRRQTKDMLDGLDDDAEDDDDDDAVSAVTDDADEEEELFSDALDSDESLGKTSFMHQDDRVHPGVTDDDGIWNTDSPTGGDMLPIEYTLEKYKDTTSSARKTEEAGSPALTQAISQVDNSLDKHNAMPFSVSQDESESPTSQMHPPSGLSSAPSSAHQADNSQASPPPIPTEESPAAGTGGKRSTSAAFTGRKLWKQTRTGGER